MYIDVVRSEQAIAAADLNGDGVLDLALASSAGYVSVVLSCRE
jgi:hypothetical protein